MLVSLLTKELRCLVRARSWPVGLLVFALVLVVLASFAFRQIGYGQEDLRQLTPGILWIIFLFCGIVALNYSFLPEEEFGAMQGLLLTRADAGSMYLAKFLVNFVFLFFVQALVIALHGMLFGVELFGVYFPLLALTAAVAFVFTALGTLLSAIAVAVRGRELILPLILFPLSLPLLAAAVFLTGTVLETGSLPLGGFWFLLVAAFDVISITLSYSLFEFVVRE